MSTHLKAEHMRIGIFGMGYVGVVSAACLLRDGHEVVGVDPVRAKVDDLSEGRTPLSEPGVAELISAGHAAGRLRATGDADEGVRGADMVWICVGTPSAPDGGLLLDHVRGAARQIGEAIARTGSIPLVVLRSTALPGTTREEVVPVLAAACGLHIGEALHVVYHPEFLREGSAVEDFDEPSRIVIGEATPGAGDSLMGLYEGYPGARFRLTWEEAELVKYGDNLFHAVKATFANELGAVARSAGIDGRRIAEVFVADTRLNISPRYLRPGFAFGGSCLPKDLRAVLRYAAQNSLPLPMLEGMLLSNARQVDALVARVLAHRPAVVGMVGLAFKPRTDDMRESPYVLVAKRLIGEGIELRIFDPGVDPARLIGGNKTAVQAALRHLEQLLVPSLDALDGANLVLINHPTVDASRVTRWLENGSHVIDLAGINDMDGKSAGYEGIAW